MAKIQVLYENERKRLLTRLNGVSPSWLVRTCGFVVWRVQCFLKNVKIKKYERYLGPHQDIRPITAKLRVPNNNTTCGEALPFATPT